MAKRKEAKEMIQYGYKAGRSTPSLDAQAVGEELERIRVCHGGQITPPVVVEESKPSDAVLHDEFEWRDKVAAERYRESQARNIINVVTVVSPTKTDYSPRAFVNVIDYAVEDEPVQSYRAIRDVMDDPHLRERVLEDVLGRLRRIQAEYRHLRELSDVWDAIDNLALVDA